MSSFLESIRRKTIVQAQRCSLNWREKTARLWLKLHTQKLRKLIIGFLQPWSNSGLVLNSFWSSAICVDYSLCYTHIRTDSRTTFSSPFSKSINTQDSQVPQRNTWVHLQNAGLKPPHYEPPWRHFSSSCVWFGCALHLTHIPEQIKPPTPAESVYAEFNWLLQEHTSWITIIVKVELWKRAGRFYCVG